MNDNWPGACAVPRDLMRRARTGEKKKVVFEPWPSIKVDTKTDMAAPVLNDLLDESL